MQQPELELSISGGPLSSEERLSIMADATYTLMEGSGVRQGAIAPELLEELVEVAERLEDTSPVTRISAVCVDCGTTEYRITFRGIPLVVTSGRPGELADELLEGLERVIEAAN